MSPGPSGQRRLRLSLGLFLFSFITCGSRTSFCPVSATGVYAERLDHFCAHDGTIVLTVRALGVLEIEGGKIVRWRDYFDTAGFAAAVGKRAT
ncbi:limonene-1,2-epoxide hydrolase family protein [Rhizobium leguminosarum]|uniref:limonene-1,2-epoxide hydrolase family protein n=1 Tax=Rhizobium leguminosarum TaxID=384 RepID=UPI003F960B22